MEEYLIVATIGGLLVLTLFVISVAEVHEQKQRENRIKILRIKQGLDLFSEILDAIKNCDVGDSIRNLITNEIIARVQVIQSLDKNFRGIEALIEEAGGNQKEPAKKENRNFIIRNEAEFKAKMVLIAHLIKLCSSSHWYSRVSVRQLQQFIIELKLLRCEKVFQYYGDKATADAEQDQFLPAKEHYLYVLHALNGSTITSNSRVLELIDQVKFMIEQMNKKILEKSEKEALEASGPEQTSQNAPSKSNTKALG